MGKLGDYILELANTYVVNVHVIDEHSIIITVEPPSHNYEPNYADELIYHMVSDAIMKLPIKYKIDEIDLYWKRESDKKPRLQIKISERDEK